MLSFDRNQINRLQFTVLTEEFRRETRIRDTLVRLSEDFHVDMDKSNSGT